MEDAESMDIRKALQSQYLAALTMLKEAVVKCPDAAWDSARDRGRTWGKAYHGAYFAHKYLLQSNLDFVPWKGHTRENGGVTASKATVLEYIDFIKRQVPREVQKADLRAGTGFSSYPNGDRLEMHLINIRHIQQHAGEIYERLDARARVKLRWVGRVHRRSQ